MTIEVTPRSLNKMVRERLKGRSLVLFLDYDGTLTPIVERPELAVLTEDTRRVLESVARQYPLYVISGRDRDDVLALVGVENIHYVGSHGFHMLGDAPGIDPDELQAALPELESAADELEACLAHIEGVLVERKQFSFALHYRLVAPQQQNQVKSAAAAVLQERSALATKKGKMVIEFVPAISWDKGKCLMALRARLEQEMGGHSVFAVYLGDDVTDEDAFGVLRDQRGLGVLVSDEKRASLAEFRLHDPDAVKSFLSGLIDE